MSFKVYRQDLNLTGEVRTLRRLVGQNIHFAFDKSEYCYFPDSNFY